MMLAMINQSFLDFQAVVTSFEKAVKNNGKTRFVQWFYDLSFKSCISVVVFTFGLISILLYPFMSPFVIILVTS